MKVLLGMPAGSTVKTATMESIVNALFASPVPISFAIKEGALGPDNRAQLAYIALANEFSHVWLVDADMTFPADTLARLLAHDKDIVGAAYNYRRLPIQTVVKMQTGTGEVIVPDSLPSALFQCYAIGSGCKLIKTSALKRIPPPWFSIRHDAQGRMDRSDDVWFCEQAKSVGIETWCDPTLDVKHVGDYAF